MSRDTRVLGQGRHSTVLAVLRATEDQRWVARKVVSAPRNGRTYGSQPHDCVKEVRILKEMDHPNIIPLIGHNYDEQLLEHHLELPLLPFSLGDLLDRHGILEDDLLKLVAFQTLLGLAHLHGHGIAHRDIKLDNIMIDWDGTIKLIDFGTAWTGGDGNEDEGADLAWRETAKDMCCSVGTGHYRAPEVLFSPTSYDPFALDIWALGVVITDSLGPVALMDEDQGTSSSGDCDSDDPLESSCRPPTSARPARTSQKLFDDTFGDVGLAASIFRILGTPTDDTWPNFHLLPDAGKIEFVDCLSRPLTHLFPDTSSTLLDLVAAMLRLDSQHRITAKSALRHSFFEDTLVPSLNQAWSGHRRDLDLSDRCVETQAGRRLVDLLEPELESERAKWSVT